MFKWLKLVAAAVLDTFLTVRGRSWQLTLTIVSYVDDITSRARATLREPCSSFPLNVEVTILICEEMLDTGVSMGAKVASAAASARRSSWPPLLAERCGKLYP